MTDRMQTFGDRLRAWREANGFSAEGLARAAGLQRNMVSNYECDLCSPSENSIRRLRAITGDAIEYPEPKARQPAAAKGDISGVLHALQRIVERGPDMASDLDRALVEAACQAAFSRAKSYPEPPPEHEEFWGILTTMLESRQQAPAPPGTTLPVTTEVKSVA